MTLNTTVPSMTSIGVMVSPAPRMSAMKTKKPNIANSPSDITSR